MIAIKSFLIRKNALDQWRCAKIEAGFGPFGAHPIGRRRFF
jgi:hypothetical protein